MQRSAISAARWIGFVLALAPAVARAEPTPATRPSQPQVQPSSLAVIYDITSAAWRPISRDPYPNSLVGPQPVGKSARAAGETDPMRDWERDVADIVSAVKLMLPPGGTVKAYQEQSHTKLAVTLATEGTSPAALSAEFERLRSVLARLDSEAGTQVEMNLSLFTLPDDALQDLPADLRATFADALARSNRGSPATLTHAQRDELVTFLQSVPSSTHLTAPRLCMFERQPVGLEVGSQYVVGADPTTTPAEQAKNLASYFDGVRMVVSAHGDEKQKLTTAAVKVEVVRILDFEKLSDATTAADNAHPRTPEYPSQAYSCLNTLLHLTPDQTGLNVLPTLKPGEHTFLLTDAKALTPPPAAQ